MIHLSFAHDHGDMIEVERVAVGGKPCPPADTLACVVAHRGGWTASGGRSDDDALRTARAFIEAWDAMLGVDRLTDPTAPADFIPPDGHERYGAPPGPPAYHPPRYEIREDHGERVVLATYYVRGHISQRGRHWSYVSTAFRVRDGVRHTIPPDSSLPPPRFWSEGG